MQGNPMNGLLWATGTGLWARLEFSISGILFLLSWLGYAGRKGRSHTIHSHSFSLKCRARRLPGVAGAQSSFVCRNIRSQHRPLQREEKRSRDRKANRGRGRKRGETQRRLPVDASLFSGPPPTSTPLPVPTGQAGAGGGSPGSYTPVG